MNICVCVCSELSNQIPKMQYLIILHFKTAQITVNFFLWITWLKFYLKFTGSHAFYLLHYRKQTLLQTSHHVLKPLAPLVPRQTAQLSPQTDGPRGGVCGAFSRRKSGAGAEDQAPEPVYRTWVCMYVYVCVCGPHETRVCVCLEHCLLATFQHHMHRLVKKCLSLLFWLLLHPTLFWD